VGSGHSSFTRGIIKEEESKRTYSRLGTAIDKRLYRCTVHLYRNIQHGHDPETLWRVFDGVSHVLHDPVLPYGFFNLSLRLDVEGIGIEEGNVPLFRGRGLFEPGLDLGQETSELGRVPRSGGIV
jgi:hypothetical protein